jgi:hypothetical protein
MKQAGCHVERGRVFAPESRDLASSLCVIVWRGHSCPRVRNVMEPARPRAGTVPSPLVRITTTHMPVADLTCTLLL